MKINDYVRTPNGIITKIIDIQDEEEQYFINNNAVSLSSKTYIADKNVTIGENFKNSPNITDLIEVGDVLVVKDFVDEACMIFTDIYLIQNEQQLINIKSDLEKNKNKKLYSIVTSEQFSQMEYKIDDKKVVGVTR